MLVWQKNNNVHLKSVWQRKKESNMRRLHICSIQNKNGLFYLHVAPRKTSGNISSLQEEFITTGIRLACWKAWCCSWHQFGLFFHESAWNFTISFFFLHCPFLPRLRQATCETRKWEKAAAVPARSQQASASSLIPKEKLTFTYSLNGVIRFGRVGCCAVDYHLNVLSYVGVRQEVQGENAFFNTALLHGASPTTVVCHCGMTSDTSSKCFAQLHFACVASLPVCSAAGSKEVIVFCPGRVAQ